jgi:hypothetical protein
VFSIQVVVCKDQTTQIALISSLIGDISDELLDTSTLTTLCHAIGLNSDFYENVRNTPNDRHITLTSVCLTAFFPMLGSIIILLIN